MRLAAARRLLLDDCEHVAQPVVAARGQKLLQLCDLDDLGDIEPPHLLHAYAPEPLHPRGRMPRATRASASPSTPTTRVLPGGDAGGELHHAAARAPRG